MYKILIMNNNVESKVFATWEAVQFAAFAYRDICRANNFKVSICIFDITQNEIRCTV